MFQKTQLSRERFPILGNFVNTTATYMKTHRYISLFYSAAALSIAVLLIFGILYINNSTDQVKYIDAVEHTYKVLSAINLCEKLLIEAESAQRGYVLTNERNYKLAFESTVPLVDSALQAIGKITADNIGQKVFFTQLSKYVATKIGVMQTNLLLTGKDPLFIDNLRTGTIVMENCKDYMSKMRAQEERLLQERVVEKNYFQRINLNFFRATFISACLICIIAIIIFFRELGIRLATQQHLKSKVNELSNSQKELEEITFAASHDLQEPMRKVRILSTLVIKRLNNKIAEGDLETVHRINKIMEQMHTLLNDLVSYTNLLNPNEKYATIDLQNVLKSAYNKAFKDGKVQFKLSGKLPSISGSAQQLETMFTQLFDNSIKFKASGRELELTVTYELQSVKESRHFWGFQSSRHYHQLTITDNGIGFDNQYNDKIFGLFQRLHTQTEYPGKGIGLSIARRVMINHQGYITSKGEKKSGASFILSFPVAD